MDVQSAANLIRGAVPHTSATWADLGAGTGTFTQALTSLLEPESRIYAIEKDVSSLETLSRLARRSNVEIIPLAGDFTTPLQLPSLDGALFANSLHYVPYEQQADVLAHVLTHVIPGGHLVVVDYHGRGPNRWVPYPVSKARFEDLTHALTLESARFVGERRSVFGGVMYAGVAAKKKEKSQEL